MSRPRSRLCTVTPPCSPVTTAGRCAGASAQELLIALREEVITVSKPGLFTLELKTTFYRPPGEGPHPLAIIRQRKTPGDSRYQARARYPVAARDVGAWAGLPIWVLKVETFFRALGLPLEKKHTIARVER